MHFQFKGKGILVIVFAIVPFIVLSILTRTIESYFFTSKFSDEIYYLVMGISLLVSGFWNNYSANEYYVDDNGDKQYIEFDNKFMWVDMKLWSYVFWAIGALASVGSLIEIVSNLVK